MSMSSRASPDLSILTTVDGPDEAPVNTPEGLPPDVDAARKNRINSDLINIFRFPCPPETVASMQGIGLYTHHGVPQLPPSQSPHEQMKATNPKFLPIGGERRMKRGVAIEARISPQVKNVWSEIMQVVNKEEQNLGNLDVDFEQLKERYGALPKPHATGTPQAGFESNPEPHPQQLSGEVRDINRGSLTGGINEERRASIGASKTVVEYHEDRDPRGKTRQRS